MMEGGYGDKEPPPGGGGGKTRGPEPSKTRVKAILASLARDSTRARYRSTCSQLSCATRLRVSASSRAISA